MIIDTHCHYNLEPLSLNVNKYWQEARDNGVDAAVVVGTNLENSKLAIKLSNKFSTMHASIGLHPENYTQAIKNFLDGDKYSQLEIDKLINKNLAEFNSLLNLELKNKKSKLIAIGEIGLDYYHLKTKGIKRNLVISMQKKVFRAQLKLAINNNLIAILHVRDQKERATNNAYFDALEIINNVIATSKTFGKTDSRTTDKETTKIINTTINPKLIFHCISGPLSYIKKVISLGGYIGVAGNITYENAPELREIIKNVPKNRLLLETDAPYLAPQNFKGQICEPRMIKKTANFLQQELRLNLDIIKKNTIKLFEENYGKLC